MRFFDQYFSDSACILFQGRKNSNLYWNFLTITRQYFFPSLGVGSMKSTCNWARDFTGGACRLSNTVWREMSKTSYEPVSVNLLTLPLLSNPYQSLSLIIQPAFFTFIWSREESVRVKNSIIFHSNMAVLELYLSHPSTFWQIFVSFSVWTKSLWLHVVHVESSLNSLLYLMMPLQLSQQQWMFWDIY